MPQYLVAIQLPDNYNPSLEGEEMLRGCASSSQCQQNRNSNPRNTET
jgi:hypothetical protein